MRIWLTASEIAGLALPGYPTTKRGVLDRAEREGWFKRGELVRLASKRGGTVQFHRDLLTLEAQACLSAKIVAQAAGSIALSARAAREPEAASLTPAAEENRDARLFVLASIESFRQGRRLSATTADNAFITSYNLGKIEVDAWIKTALPELSFRTVARWRAMAKAGTMHRLAVDHGAKRRGKGVLDRPEVRTRMLALMVAQPDLPTGKLLDNLRDHFPDLKMPAERTVRLARASLKESEKVMLSKLTNPDAFNNKYRLSGTNSHDVQNLNELWMIDASPVDVLTLDGRQSVYAAIDIYSRRVMLHITPTPRAEAVGELLRRGILAWGAPRRLKTDNGSDFVAKASKRLFTALGIEVDQCTPFSGWEKGHVERVIRTFQHDFGPLMPGFCGHNVAERKVIEARRSFAQRLGDTDMNAFSVELTAVELQGYADRWATEVYAHSVHSALKITPFARAAGWVGERKTVDVRTLDVLLQPIAGRDGIRTMQKTGIQVDGSHYHCASVLPDTKVLVRMDRHDMGKALLFTPEGDEFLGEAECYALTGVDPKEAVKAQRAEQNRIIAERSAEVRAEVKKIKPRDMIDAVLRQAAKKNGVLVEFPRAGVAHSTPAIEAAAEAVAARAAEQSRAEPSIEDMRAMFARDDERRREAADKAQSVLLGAQASVGGDGAVVALRTKATPAQRYAYASGILARLDEAVRSGARQLPVPDHEMSWALAHQRDAEFIGQLPTKESRYLHVRRLNELEATCGELWPHEQAWRKTYRLRA